MRVIGVHVRTSAESICPVQFLAAFPVLLPRECVQNGVAQVAQTVSCKCRSVQVLEHTFTVMNNEFLSPENWEMAVPTSGRLLLPAEHRSPHNPGESCCQVGPGHSRGVKDEHGQSQLAHNSMSRDLASWSCWCDGFALLIGGEEAVRCSAIPHSCCHLRTQPQCARL